MQSNTLNDITLMYTGDIKSNWHANIWPVNYFHNVFEVKHGYAPRRLCGRKRQQNSTSGSDSEGIRQTTRAQCQWQVVVLYVF